MELKRQYSSCEDLFEDPLYSDFFNDYNQIIHDEIRQNNIVNVVQLCEQLYRNEAYPYYNDMLEVAISDANFTTFVVVFTMWCFCYENRDTSMTYLRANELLMSTSAINISSVDEKKTLLYLVNRIIDEENIIYHGDSMVSKNQIQDILELCKKYIRDLNIGELPSWILKGVQSKFARRDHI